MWNVYGELPKQLLLSFTIIIFRLNGPVIKWKKTEMT